MAIITEQIAPRKFELIRDRIATILQSEITNQAAIQSDPKLNAVVFLERFVPFQEVEMPAINVGFANGDYQNLTQIKQEGTYNFNIDVYYSANTTVANRADQIASVDLQRLMGVCQNILSHQRYNTLGFAAPYIQHVEVSSIKIAQPENNKDASSVMMGRLVFTVIAPESNVTTVPTLIAGYDTQVLIGNTLNGYVFSGTSLPLPPVTCAPGEVRDSGGLVLGQAPSGGFFGVADSIVSNSDDSDVVNVLATQNLEIEDITYNIYIDNLLIHTEDGPNYFL